MNKKSIISAAIFLSFIAQALIGCSVGPDYAAREDNMPERWTGLEKDSVLKTDEKPETAKWWDNFKDPVLSSLVEKGLKNNHDIKMASARLRQSRASQKAAFSSLWPQLEANASYKRSGAGDSGRTGSVQQGSITDTKDYSEYDSYKAGFDSAWELDFFGGNRRLAEAAIADVTASMEDERSVAVSVAAEIATDYLNLRSVQDQINSAEKNLDAQKQILEITKKKFEAGLTGRLDFTSAKGQVESSKARIPELKARERSLIYSLGLLTGDYAGLVSSLSEKSSLPPSPPMIPVGLPSDLLKRRADIRKAEAKLHAATARIGAAKADYFPKISLTGSFAYSGSDADSFLNWSSRSWNFGPSVSVPVFNAGRIAANVEAKTAIEEETLAGYEKTVLSALKDVETSLFTYSRDMERHDFLAKAAKENADAADMAMKLYTAGKINYTRVLDARKTQYSSEETLVQSNGLLATDLVAIYKALGGGWEATSKE